MSTEPMPLVLASTTDVGAEGVANAAVARTASDLDRSLWEGWWRDLILERYRVDRFELFVPLPTDTSSWELRVALGRLVEQVTTAVHGPMLATRLVVDALATAGFGPVRDLVPDARRAALVRSGWWCDDWNVDDDLRLGVLGSIADALLRENPTADLDLRRDPAIGEPATTRLVATVEAATHDAVLAYARHVEVVASRARVVARAYQF